MKTSTFLIIPSDIVEITIAYVFEKTGVRLAEDRLQDLYKRAYDRRVLIKDFVRRKPHVKIATTLYAAKQWVLDQEFPPEELLRVPEMRRYRKAYSMGVSKAGSEFSKRQERERTLRMKRPERERIADFVTLDKGGRQYRFIL